MHDLSYDCLLSRYSWLKTTFFLTSFFLIGFWAYFYLVEARSPDISICYLSHEIAFVIPDLIWIVGLLLLSYYWLSKNNPKGIISAAAAGGALVFLSLIDISYNFSQGLYWSDLGEGILNVIINILSLGYGLTLLFVGYGLLKMRVVQLSPN